MDGIDYRLLQASAAKTLGNPRTPAATKATGVFVVVRIGAHSRRKQSETLSDSSIKLTAPGDRRYSVSSGPSAAVMGSSSSDAQPFFLRRLNPGQTITGLVVFDVPPSVLKENAEIRFSGLGLGDTHGYIRLPEPPLSSSGATNATTATTTTTTP